MMSFRSGMRTMGFAHEHATGARRVRTWFHVGRVAGGDCHYRNFDRAAFAGDSSGAGGRPPHAVQEQFEANGLGGPAHFSTQKFFPDQRLGMELGRRCRSWVWHQSARRLGL